eukprot:8377103-Alexandrium_andersonii.AAC.1
MMPQSLPDRHATRTAPASTVIRSLPSCSPRRSRACKSPRSRRIFGGPGPRLHGPWRPRTARAAS